jgi:replicative DNA helicase
VNDNSNSYSEAGGIYEELRGVAGELQVPIWSASQSNRAAMSMKILFRQITFQIVIVRL